MEGTLSEFRERIHAAARFIKTGTGTDAQSRSGLCIRGNGSKDWYGQAVQGEPLDCRPYAGIIDYEPTELVITARCGTPLAEIEAALAQQRQMLAFEPPHFGPQATLGGMIATGLSGPRRQAVGAVRDFVLGCVLMNGEGKVLHFGGQVMKNVAGYDVSRLLAGSLGTLGLLLEVSLKVLPQPSVEITLRLAMQQRAAIEQLNRWGGMPLPISGSLWHDDGLMVRLSGADAAVQAARKVIGGELIDGRDLWIGVREQSLPFFTDREQTAPLWRLSVPSATAELDLPGSVLIEWGGAQRWLRTAASASTVRSIAESVGGHATLFRGGDKNDGVFHPLQPVVAGIHQRLKRKFDPDGVFNPGRMYSEF
jgi:glycolate oxidase FAD binding subunit